MKLLLVRHGATQLNIEGMFQGQSDSELSPAGLQQAEKLRDRLKDEKIDFVYSSDLRRALVTAQTIALPHKNLEIVTCPELREMDYGELEGLTFFQIQDRYPDIAGLCVTWSPDLRFPEGETVANLQQRIRKFLNRLKSHPSEHTVVVVAHGGPLRLMICDLLGIGVKHWRQVYIDLASLSIVNCYPEVSILNLLNDTSHLR